MIPEVVVAVAVGFGSALLPLINAEAFQAGSSLQQPPSVIKACVVALSVGQTGGKVLIFTGSRRGARRWRSAHARRSARSARPPVTISARRLQVRAGLRRTNAAMLESLSHPLGGPVTVAVSATVGVPPLAIVSAAAGLSTMRCSNFALVCLVGRFVRFATLAGLVAAITGS